MKLKTFTAPTMADALAAVRKDFGPDAMILHTRSYRVGSWFGLGGKNMVEITASAGEPDRKPRARPARPQVTHRDHHPDERETADDRDAVLGGRVPARSQTARPAPRDPAEFVVQRASAVVEPKPELSQSRQPEPAAAAPLRQDAARDPMARTPLATRLTRRDDQPRPPVRIADATPPPPSAPNPSAGGPPWTPGSIPGSAPGSTRTPTTPDNPPRTPRREEPDATPPRPRTQADHLPRLDPDDARPPAEPKPALRTPAADDPDALKGQIAELQKMMGQVLESTRRTSVAMAKVDPRAAEGVQPGPLLTYINRLVDNDAPMNTVDAIAGRVRDRLDAAELKDDLVVRQAVLREIEATIDTRSDSFLAISAGTSTGRPRVIALIGPTGVGKTTTVAKLAATCKLRHARRVGLITSDTYRIAAVEQLRTYAGIIGLPLKVANTPEEMSQAISDFAAMDVIIVDTAGRSQHDARRLDELKAFIAAADPDETHLVLASTVGDTVMQRTAQKFMPLGPDRCILTKLDEAVCTGQLAGLTARIGLPFSFVTVGQEVPDDIEPARADRLARVALDGPGVLCKGSDGRD